MFHIVFTKQIIHQFLIRGKTSCIDINCLRLSGFGKHNVRLRWDSSSGATGAITTHLGAAAGAKMAW